jgi:hypothetical protein
LTWLISQENFSIYIGIESFKPYMSNVITFAILVLIIYAASNLSWTKIGKDIPVTGREGP